MKIILATTSPYRRRAFKELGLKFSCVASKISEKFSNRPANPRQLVRKLARLKAKAVANKYPNDLVVGCDSVGWFRDKILEKPKSKEEEFKRMKMLSGNEFKFYTGVCIIKKQSDEVSERVVETKIRMRKISAAEIEKYLAQDPNYKTYAMGFDPFKHYSSTFIRRIMGSHNNFLVGFPLEEVMEMLFDFGYKL
jgi:septum formation protein